MELQIESNHIEDYLKEIEGVIDFKHAIVKEKIDEIKNQTNDKMERAKIAFEFVRDNIQHSFDDEKCISVTISAADALSKREGICFAKAHLLAALLRGMEIPTGFCYQRVMKKGTPQSGYALHGLNAIYDEELGWLRLDPRGNKEGISSEFSIGEEKLAYRIHPDLDEVDYPYVFTQPREDVLESMRRAQNSDELFKNRPEIIGN